MKNTTLTASLVAALIAGGMFLSSGSLLAQTVESTTTTTSSGGTITEFGPSSLVVRTESAPAPVHYTFSKTTTYVDEAGNPVSIETVKSGAPVQVYYSRVGDDMVASKVIVKKTVVAPEPAPQIIEKKTTTTTTTSEK